MLSVHDIKNIESRKNVLKKELYKTILESFSKKILANVNVGQTQAFLTVPGFVMGYPTFDRLQAREYLARQLKNLGYNVITYQDFDLYVTWKREPKREEVTTGLPAFVNLHKIADSYRKQKR
jgi:hypothetical protein